MVAPSRSILDNWGAMKHPLRVRDADQIVTDRWNNEKRVPGDWRDVLVLGWVVNNVSEGDDDSVLREIDRIEVYMDPADAPDAAGEVQTPDGETFQVRGRPANYNHGPWWQPGLVVVTAERTKG